MIEGIVEIIMSIFYSINNDPFEELRVQYEENSAGSFTLLVFLLIVYFLLTAIMNPYKIYCNCYYILFCTWRRFSK